VSIALNAVASGVEMGAKLKPRLRVSEALWDAILAQIELPLRQVLDCQAPGGRNQRQYQPRAAASFHVARNGGHHTHEESGSELIRVTPA